MRSLADQPHLALSDEVAEGLASSRPMVALESSFLTHGLTPNKRIETALQLEATIRSAGAIPATIAIVDGRMRVGLDDVTLGRVINEGTKQVSLCNLAPALAKGGVWSTTVAATMAVAHRAGIRWLATSGLGGVYRWAESAYAESADLSALSRFSVGVVCSGAQVILDLPQTMERLEALGIPVVGFCISELPVCYHSTSGMSLVTQIGSVDELARIAITRFDHLEESGFVVVQHPPPEVESQDPDQVEQWIQAALKVVENSGVKGQEMMAYLMTAIDQASDGIVVRTNTALVMANARLAAQAAWADMRLCTDSGSQLVDRSTR